MSSSPWQQGFGWTDFAMKIERLWLLLIVCSALFLPGVALAQSGPGILRGQVTDPSGAAIAKANVVLTPATGSPLTTQTDAQGLHEFKGLPAGKYTLNVIAHEFTIYENDDVEIGDQPLRLNVPLTIEVETQKLQVSDT